jgi:phosphoesterase RecJ-like protein
MEGSPKQEAQELIRQADDILIPLSVRPDEDAVGSAVALKLFLEKIGKRVTILSLDPLPEKVKFLNGTAEVVSELSSGRDFIISLKTEAASAEKLSYNITDGTLNIVVTTKEGSFKPEDVSFASGKPKVDLIIAVDTASLGRLGEVPAKYSELFNGAIPILNIDHHASDDFFGTVNLVDPLAASTSEILIGLFEAINRELIDENIATALLMGLLSDTASFQNTNTTPKSLTVAAQLLGFGAHHADIIRHLFKTKSFAALKLWGRALHRLSFNKEAGLVWSKLTRQDFEETGASPDETSGLIDQLIKTTTGAKVALLLEEYEKNYIDGSLRSVLPEVDVLTIAERLGGGGHRAAAGFQMAGSLDEVERKVVDLIVRDLAPSLEEPPLSPLQ